MAATPVGAATTMFLDEWSTKYFKKVVFPVPALPVRKTFSLVSVMKRKARSNTSFISTLAIMLLYSKLMIMSVFIMVSYPEKYVLIPIVSLLEWIIVNGWVDHHAGNPGHWVPA